MRLVFWIRARGEHSYASVNMVPMPSLVRVSIRMAWGIVPSMMKAWVNQDTATLRLVMNDHAFAQVNSVIQMQQAEGLEMDKTIMEVRDVELEVR